MQLGAHGSPVGEPANERLQLRRHTACHGCLDDHVLQPAVLAQQQLRSPASHHHLLSQRRAPWCLSTHTCSRTSATIILHVKTGATTV